MYLYFIHGSVGLLRPGLRCCFMRTSGCSAFYYGPVLSGSEDAASWLLTSGCLLLLLLPAVWFHRQACNNKHDWASLSTFELCVLSSQGENQRQLTAPAFRLHASTAAGNVSPPTPLGVLPLSLSPPTHSFSPLLDTAGSPVFFVAFFWAFLFSIAVRRHYSTSVTPPHSLFPPPRWPLIHLRTVYSQHSRHFWKSSERRDAPARRSWRSHDSCFILQPCPCVMLLSHQRISGLISFFFLKKGGCTHCQFLKPFMCIF